MARARKNATGLVPRVIILRFKDRSAEPTEIEGSEINARAAVDDPLRQRFADRRGVFEAMTRARRRNDYPIRLRMSIDDEPEVGRQCVEARCGPATCARDTVDVRCHVVFV